MANTPLPPQTDTVEQKLRAGVERFQREVFSPRREAYEKAATEPQQPHTLVVTCADSRVDPESLTQAGPGEIFVKRNIGNMVPEAGSSAGGAHAVIEYAVAVLGVQHIVICGHTDCGAMKALLSGPTHLPDVDRWLANGQQALERARAVSDGHATLEIVTEQNVLLQLEHLRALPAVSNALARHSLTLAGWIYDIYSGDVRILDPASSRFISMLPDESPR